MAIIMGGRYKLMKHPYRPIGIARSSFSGTKEILIEWEDPGLIPQSERYPEDAFVNGTLEFIGFGKLEGNKFNPTDNTCWHEYVTYKGFNEEYDYCKKCDAKKESQ